MSKKHEKYPGVDWFCDSCNAYLNDQNGFDDYHSVWKCTECGYTNCISADNIIEFCDEYDSDYDEYDSDYDEDCSERLSVYDAADIWMSSGKDEDYTFGYSIEELESAISRRW